MNKYYISFGEMHIHEVGDKLFHKDLLCMIEAGTCLEARETAFETFGKRWGFCYDHRCLEEIIHNFPEGILAL